MGMAKDCTRINLNIPNDLLEKIEAYAKSMNVNRTSAICVMCSTVIQQQESLRAVSSLENMLDYIKREQGGELQNS